MRVRKISVDKSGNDTLTVRYKDSEYDLKNRYIHKYYLSAKDKGKLSPIDLDALETSTGADHYELWTGKIPEVVNGCTILYQDIGSEKQVDSDLVRRGLLAIAGYYKDRRSELTPEELRAALNLNDWLREYEKTLLARQLCLEEELRNGLRGNDPFLVDYEIDLNLQFYVREDDLFYDNEEADKYDWDNHSALMLSLKGVEAHSSRAEIHDPNYRGLGDDQDHNDIRDHEHINPIYRAMHCTLFHELTNHCAVPFKHLIRIGLICAEFVVQHQNYVNIDLTGERIFARQQDTWQGKLNKTSRNFAITDVHLPLPYVQSNQIAQKSREQNMSINLAGENNGTKNPAAELTHSAVKAIMDMLRSEFDKLQVPPAGLTYLGEFKQKLKPYQDFIANCHGELFCGSAKASGHDRATISVQQAFKNMYSTLPDTAIICMFVSIEASADLIMSEYNEINRFLRTENPDVDIRIGCTFNKEWSDTVEITILAGIRI